MPDPRVQTGEDPERLTGISPEVPDGFVLSLLTGIGRWAKLSHVCGGEHTFVGPSADRVRWYVSRHRCGPGRWDEGEQPVEPAAIEEGGDDDDEHEAGPTPVERLIVVLDEIATLIDDVPGEAEPGEVDALRAAVRRCGRAVRRRFPMPGDELEVATAFVAHLVGEIGSAEFTDDHAVVLISHMRELLDLIDVVLAHRARVLDRTEAETAP